MDKIKRTLASPKTSLAAFVLAMGLLLFASVGGARAALTYFSETYISRVEMYDIGVTLVENDASVSWRDYKNEADGTWDEAEGALLTKMLKKDGSLKIGKTYKEELRVRNSGTINQYVRVSLYKYWEDKDGNKLQNLSPDLIRLHLVNTGAKKDWLIDKEASTAERTVLYYNKLLDSGASTPLFADTLTIDDMVATKVTQTTTTKDGYTTVRTVYDYDGVKFCIDAKVDAVQEHNAQDAAWSAWGRKVIVKDGRLRLDQGGE